MFRLNTIALAAMLVSVAGLASAENIQLTRDDAAGAKYGAPGPRTCSTMSEPQDGPLTPEDARAYVICGQEADFQGDGEALYLLGDVQVKIINVRPYNDDPVGDIDVSKPVYEIAGSSVMYSCVMNDGVLSADQQCIKTPENNATGLCFQHTDGQWQCTWTDTTVSISSDTRLRGPAPTLAEAE